jgi:hypothetical protein
VRFHTPKITKTREAGHVAQQVEYLCLSKTRPRVQNSSTTTIKKKKKKTDWLIGFKNNNQLLAKINKPHRGKI